MAKDVNLRIIPIAAGGAAIALQTAEDKGNVLEVEGGGFAVVRLYLGTCTGTTAVVEVAVQASVDGTNFFHIGRFPAFSEESDDLEIARVVYVPVPTLASSLVTKVKLTTVVSTGTTPVVPCNAAYLEPLVSLAAPEIDVDQTKGLEALV